MAMAGEKSNMLTVRCIVSYNLSLDDSFEQSCLVIFFVVVHIDHFLTLSQ